MTAAQTVLWSPQEGPQTALLSCPIFEVFYGGARGGGKTEASIGDWIEHSSTYGEAAIGIFVRRKFKQLAEVIARTKQLFPKLGGKYNESKAEWRMGNGARLKFVYLERDADAEEYQGHSYTRVYIEEITNFPFPGPIDKLRATLRSGSGVPVGMRCTGNPGGPGHNWVKKRYIDPDPRGFKVIDETCQVEIDGAMQTVSLSRVFIPSKLGDNMLLLRNDPTYVLRLRQSGSEQLVKAWLEGDWNIVDGAFFEEFDEAVHVKPSMLIKSATPQTIRFRSFDWGSARPFNVGWYAICDGLWPPNEPFPSGALFKYREWYGAKDANVGLKMTASEVQDELLCQEEGERIRYAVADPSIFIRNGGPSIAESMARCRWRKADNKRQPGWEALRQRLVGENGVPMIYFGDQCEDSIRTIPILQHDEHDPEDLDTDGEDHCFTGDTLVQTLAGPLPIQNLTSGEVPTLFGPQKFTARLTRKRAKIIRLTLDTRETILCTPDHKFLTPTGWVRAKNLKGVQLCLLKYSQEKNKDMAGKTTTNAGDIFKEKEFAFTGKFTSMFMERFLKIPTSTTSTATSATMSLKTFNWSSGHNTLPIIWQSGFQTVRKLGNEKQLLQIVLKLPANIATNFINLFTQMIDSVPLRVKPPLVEKAELTILQQVAYRVARNLLKTNTQKDNSVPTIIGVEEVANREDVYCLSVPEAEHFVLASGVIVSNCADETRYAVMSRPWKPAPPIQPVASIYANDVYHTPIMEMIKANGRKRREREMV